MCRPSAHDQVFSTTSRKEENTSSGRGEDNNDFYHVYLHSGPVRSLGHAITVGTSDVKHVTSRDHAKTKSQFSRFGKQIDKKNFYHQTQ